MHLVDLTSSQEPQKPATPASFITSPSSDRGFEAMKSHLASKGVEFRTVAVPGNRLWQIFVRDPNGVMVELNYDAAAEPAG